MFKPGDKVFIRTVTYHALGQVESVEGNWLALSSASWVADSGRLGEAVANGTLSEVEYVGEMMVNADTAVDAFPWKHDLPTASK